MERDTLHIHLLLNLLGTPLSFVFVIKILEDSMVVVVVVVV